MLIETVGVGQSETMVAGMVGRLHASSGSSRRQADDELQGVKRGIMELADLILVNKADGDLEPAANRTCADYAGALKLLRPRPEDPPGFPKALTVSAVEQTGLAKAWAELRTLSDWRRENSHFSARRARQNRQWFEEEVRRGLLARLDTDPGTRAALTALGAEVEAGTRAPAAAAADLLATLD